MQRPPSSWGTSPESRHKAHFGTQRILLTPCPSVELPSEDLHKYVPSYSLYLKPTQPAKVALDKGQWLDKASHFQGSQEANINPLHSAPLRGRDWVNPLWFSEVTPLTHQQVETSPLREKPWWPGEWSLCLWSRKSLQAPPLHPEGPRQAETCSPHPKSPWGCSQGPGWW